MALSIIDPTGNNTSGDGEYKRVGDVKPGWNLSGDATPHSIASTDGGTGTLTFNASQAGGESDLLIAREVMANGNIGKFSSATLQGENVSLSMDTILARLNTQRTAKTWATDHYAGDIQFPTSFSTVWNGSTKNFVLPGNTLTITGADAHGDYVYFYGWISSFTAPTGSVPLVFRFTSTGIFSSVWSPSGGTASTDTTLAPAGGFAIDYVNNFIYLGATTAATGGNWVRKYTMTGTYVSEFRPGATSGFASLVRDLAVDNDGNIYVSGGPSGNVIQKFSPAGVRLAGMGTNTDVGDFGLGIDALTTPPKIVFDGTNLIVLNSRKMVLRAYTKSFVYFSTLTKDVNSYGLQLPGPLAVDRANRIIYVVSAYSAISTVDTYPRLWTFTAWGRDDPYTSIKVTPISHAETRFINAMAVDGKGRLFLPRSSDKVQPGNMTKTVLQMHFEGDHASPLSTMMHYYLSLAIPVGEFEFRFNTTDKNVVFPAWEGNVWEYMKELCAAWGLEMRTSATSTNAAATRFKPVIEVTAIGAFPEPLDQTDAGSLTLSVSMGTPVRSYMVTAQNPVEAKLGNRTIVYSTGRDGGTFSVDPGQRIFTQVNTPHSIMYVAATVPELYFWGTEPGPGFEVYDNQNVRVTPGLFTSYAGRIEARVIDHHTIGLTITGPYIDLPGFEAPYKFASPVGEGRLNIGGSGTLIYPRDITLWTGADENYVTGGSGPKIDSPFISDVTQVYDRGAWASLELSGPRLELRYDVVNTYPTPGQRISYNHQNWRVISVQRTATGASVTAIPYTTVADRDAVWAGKTVAQHDAFWSGYRVYDSKVRPLQSTR